MTVIMPDSNIFSNNQFLIIIILIILLQLRERKIRPIGLFILPLLLILLTISFVSTEISGIFDAIILIGGYLLGTVLGLVIGKFMDVKVDETSNKIILKGSYIAVGLWIAIILLKVYGENFLNQTGIIKVDLVLALFLMITLGTMVSRRIFIYWKYLKHKKTKQS